jgi:hypothetical protein
MHLLPLETPIWRLQSLECVEPSCTTRVPLFVEWSETTSAEERLADTETWEWGHLLCPQGHEIPKPSFSL